MFIMFELKTVAAHDQPSAPAGESISAPSVPRLIISLGWRYVQSINKIAVPTRCGLAKRSCLMFPRRSIALCIKPYSRIRLGGMRPLRNFCTTCAIQTLDWATLFVTAHRTKPGRVLARAIGDPKLAVYLPFYLSVRS